MVERIEFEKEFLECIDRLGENIYDALMEVAKAIIKLVDKENNQEG